MYLNRVQRSNKRDNFPFRINLLKIFRNMSVADRCDRITGAIPPYKLGDLRLVSMACKKVFLNAFWENRIVVLDTIPAS